MKRVIWVDIGIAGINLCFLTLYGILIANDRLAVDDFHFLAILKEHGVFGGVAFEYGDWSTRWPSTFLTNIFLLLHEVTGYGLILHGVLGLGVFVSAINLFMRGFFSRVLAWTDKGSGGKGRSLYASDDGDFVLTFLLYRSEGPRWLLWNLSIFLAAVVFLTTIRIDETWFWLCASCTYLWGMIMLVLGAACLIHPNRDRIMTILACLAFLYVGGASGPLALFVLFLMVSVILGAWLKRGTGMLSLNDPFRRRIYPAFIACLVGFIILYMGEGNRAREAFFEDIGVGEALILNVKMTGIVLLKRVPQKLPLMIAASVPMVLVGGTLNKGFSSSVLTRGVFWGVVLYGLLIFIYQLPVTYKTQDVAAYRTLFPVTFLCLPFLHDRGLAPTR